MTLTDKRKELFEEVFDKKIEKELFVIFNCIDDQDKQAVKELKEEIKLSEEANGGSIFVNEVFEDMDKIFGEELK